jgi:hypothetical protein
MTAALPPVRRSVHVPLSPAEAFALFTESARLWWPFAGHSCSGERGADLRFEPRAGGAVVEHAPDGRQWTWGTLSAWEPPRRFAMSWHPGLPLAEATLLEVSFDAVGDGCEVRVEHGGWEARGDEAATKRDQYDHGWPHTLQAYAEAASRRNA